jgi:antitoxin VapB
MQLNIKNGEAYRLATELAELTGESLTEAVTKALAERLAQEKRERSQVNVAQIDRLERLKQKLRPLQERARAMRQDAPEITEIDLYDEHGLPR